MALIRFKASNYSVMIAKYYFLLSLLLVIVSYFFIRKQNWTSDKYALFENKYIYSIVIGAALFVGINYNLDYQLFCNPVKWTFGILIPVLTWLILFPHLLHLKFLNGFNSLLYGFSLSVLGYILLFGRGPYLIMLAVVSIVGVPLFLYSKKLKLQQNRFLFDWINFYALTFFAPLYLFYLLISKFKEFNKFLALIPIIGILLFSLYSSIKMNEYESLIMKSQLNEHKIAAIKTSPLNTYYLELVLGLHWKYHTRMAVVDGWRPPFHDPIVGMRFNLFSSSKHNSYFILKEWYKYVFPERETAFECKCAKNMIWIN